MKKFTLLLLLISAFAFSQNQRLMYEYKFVTDSTNRAEVLSEILVLDITKDGSKYYSYPKYQADSISKAEIDKQIATGSWNININNSYNGKIHYSVEKSYPDFKVILNNSVGGDDYKISDDRKMQWKILPEKQKIGTFNAQKAETKMYGRTWTAWFTTEILIQDGPYKFHGLPGIIIKIEDKTQSHIMDLKGIRTLPETDLKKKVSEEERIAIDYKKYKKLFWENRKDPAKSLRELMASGGSFKIVKNGVELSTAEALRDREQTAKENQKKNNNFLELDLLSEK